MRPPPVRYRLLVERARVSLRDSQGMTVDPMVPKPNAVPVRYRMTSRTGSFEFAAIRLQWPSKSIVVGVWNTSLHWSADTPRTRKLDYIVGDEEWHLLVRALGLR